MKGLLFVITCAAALCLWIRALVPSGPAPVPAPSVNTLLARSDDFDLVKKNRQIDWCEQHHGVPTMTFTRNHSNVLCLRPEAVIELP